MDAVHPSTPTASSSSHGMNGKDNAPAHPKSDCKLSSMPGVPGEKNESYEMEDPDEDERARNEALCRRTTALRMQFELYGLDHFDSFAQEYLDDIDETQFSQMPREEDNEVGGTAWDDTSSMSSGMDWFLPSPSDSEFGDDDAMSLHAWCESQKKDDEASVARERKKAEDALHAAELDDQGTCFFMKLPPEIRCLIYKYCLPPKQDRSLICMSPTKSRNQWFLTPVSHEEPRHDQLPSFSSNLQIYPLNGRRATPIQREPDFVGQTILAVNRLIYEEASQDFYKTHTFRFNSRQIESLDLSSGLIPRLRNIEIEDAVFRFSLRSTESKLIRLSRNPNLERVIIGPRTAEGLFSVIRHRKSNNSCDAYGWTTKAVKPFAGNMYNAEYFRLQPWPSLPKVAIVSLNISAVLAVMRKVNTLGPLPSIPRPLLWSDVTIYFQPPQFSTISASYSLY